MSKNENSNVQNADVIFPIHFGIDYARFNFSYDFTYLSDLFIGLSHNSDFVGSLSFYGNTYIAYYIGTQGSKILKLVKSGVPQIEIKKHLTLNTIQKNYYTVSFYGGYFQTMEDSHVIQKIASKSDSLTRLDICLDLPYSVNCVLDSYTTRSKKFTSFENDGNTETYYIGSKSNNSKHFIRIYDKLLDSQKKEKIDLYGHYFDYTAVSRIEVEVKSDSLKKYNISPQTIIDHYSSKNNDIHNLFRTLCNNTKTTNLQILDKVNYSSCTVLKKHITEIDFDRINYFKTFMGYARNIKKMGIDPVNYLQDNL